LKRIFLGKKIGKFLNKVFATIHSLFKNQRKILHELSARKFLFSMKLRSSSLVADPFAKLQPNPRKLKINETNQNFTLHGKKESLFRAQKFSFQVKS